jgi:hypothetical protein
MPCLKPMPPWIVAMNHFPSGCQLSGVEVLDLLVRVLADLAAGQVVGEDALRRHVRDVSLSSSARRNAILAPSAAPAGLARVVGDLHPLAAVEVHDVEVPDLLLALALVGAEADLRPVGRDLRIELVDVGRVGEVDLAFGAVGVLDPEVPVPAAVAFADDLVLAALQERQSSSGFPLGKRRGRRPSGDGSGSSRASDEQRRRGQRERVLAERRGAASGPRACPTGSASHRAFGRAGRAAAPPSGLQVTHGRGLPTSP